VTSGCSVGLVTTAARSAGSAENIGGVSYPPPPPPPGPPAYGYGYGGYPPQQYWAPPPPIDPKQLKPSRLWYWLSAIPIAAGLVIAAVCVGLFIKNLDPDIDNFRSNRTAQLQFDGGDRSLYVQTRQNGVPIRVPPDDLRCSVTSTGTDAQPVKLTKAGGATLDVNNDSYAEEYSFDAPHDGVYRVLCEGPEGVKLAIGPDLSFDLFVPLILAFVAVVLGGILTTVGLVVTAVRRSNHKQRLQREAREAAARGYS
jgi:hypothetical protein